MTDATYVLERNFDAPAQKVWACWTDPELLAQWYGPGVDTIIHELNATKGGVWLTEMRMSQGSSFQKAAFLEAVPNERLVWLHSNTDENWTIQANPMMPNWPRLLMSTLTLTQDGDQTKMRFEWVPHDATDDEITCFSGAMEGMGKGWSMGMDTLAKLVAQ